MMKLLKIKPWSLHQNVVPFLETNHGYEQQHKGLVIQKNEYQSPHFYFNKLKIKALIMK